MKLIFWENSDLAKVDRVKTFACDAKSAVQPRSDDQRLDSLFFAPFYIFMADSISGIDQVQVCAEKVISFSVKVSGF